MTRTDEVDVAEEVASDAETGPAPPHWLRPARNWVSRRPAGLLIWRIGIAVLGGAIVAGGLLLIPLPGPGWAIVFLGLAVWATEFVWAQRLLRFGRRVLRRWTDWARRQSLWVRGLLGLAGLLLLGGLAWLGWQLVR
ncbi:MAG: TIGR02611 family protein [Jatrophihabitantaceae bacterium]